MRGTTIHYMSPEWIDLTKSNQRAMPDGRWVPARYYGNRTGFFERLQAAWLVFTGRADAVMWPEDYDRRSLNRDGAYRMIEEDGCEVFIPIEFVLCCKKRLRSDDGFWRCPQCRLSYGPDDYKRGMKLGAEHQKEQYA